MHIYNIFYSPLVSLDPRVNKRHSVIIGLGRKIRPGKVDYVLIKRPDLNRFWAQVGLEKKSNKKFESRVFIAFYRQSLTPIIVIPGLIDHPGQFPKVGNKKVDLLIKSVDLTILPKSVDLTILPKSVDFTKSCWFYHQFYKSCRFHRRYFCPSAQIILFRP